MGVDPNATLGIIAAMVGLGFLGYLLFERTRVTDVLILIGFGVLVGPVLGLFDVAAFSAASGLVGTLALVVIMFDGGLGLRLRDLVTGIARSTLLALVGFGLTIAAVAAVAHLALGLAWMPALLLATIVGGTSGVIVMPIISRTSARPATSVLLSVESALTDVLCVIGTVTLVALAAGASGGAFGPGELGLALRSVTAQFSVAVVFGLAAGLLWLRLLRALRGRRNGYMLTLAATLGLFAATGAMGGSGAVAVLIFGIVLGNGFALSRKLAMDGAEFSGEQRQLQGEVAFLVRVFFFVYLGVILDPALLLEPRFLRDGALVLLACLGARVVAVLATTRGDPELRADRALVTFLFPRGLAAAVLAGVPALAGVPGTGDFVAYAFVVIVGSNLVGTATVVLYEFRKRRAGAPAPLAALGEGGPVPIAGVVKPPPPP